MKQINHTKNQLTPAQRGHLSNQHDVVDIIAQDRRCINDASRIVEGKRKNPGQNKESIAKFAAVPPRIDGPAVLAGLERGHDGAHVAGRGVRGDEALDHPVRHERRSVAVLEQVVDQRGRLMPAPCVNQSHHWIASTDQHSTRMGHRVERGGAGLGNA